MKNAFEKLEITFKHEIMLKIGISKFCQLKTSLPSQENKENPMLSTFGNMG